MVRRKQPTFIHWIIWSLSVAFYFYEYFLRVSPSVMVSDLMKTFSISAGGVGLLSAFYFFAYAPMQLPVGLLIDTMGARRLLPAACFVCVVGAFLFGIAPDLYVAWIGRFLTGLGSAFAFVSFVYISSHYFPESRLAFLVGMGNSIGMLGAVFGLGPYSFFEEMYGFSDTLYTLAVLGALLGILIALVLYFEPAKMKNRDQQRNVTKNFAHSLKLVCKNRKTWMNALIALFFYNITSSFAGLWATPFFENVYDMGKHGASFAGSLFFIGWIIGGPIIGHYSDKSNRRKPHLIWTIVLSLFALCLLLYFPIWSEIMVYILVFLLGCFASGQLLCYSLSIEVNNQKAKGTAIAMTNFIVFIGACGFQPLVGYILDLSQLGKDYTVRNYQTALSFFTLSLIIALVITLFLRKRKLKSLPEKRHEK